MRLGRTSTVTFKNRGDQGHLHGVWRDPLRAGHREVQGSLACDYLALAHRDVVSFQHLSHQLVWRTVLILKEL